MKRFMVTAMLAAILAAQPVFCSMADEYGFMAEKGEIISYVGTDEYILVPAESDGQKITAIGEKAFAEQKAYDIQIESGIKSIKKDAFKGAEMSTLTLSDTIESVADGAFAECKNLSNVTLVNYETRFEKGALAKTGNIVFWVNCEISWAEEQRLLDNLVEAKGDENLQIEKLHDYDIDPNGTYICTVCGHKYDPVTDVLREGGALDDGREPGEADMPMDGDGPDASEWGTGDGKWGEPTFSDVTADAWYFDYVETAVEQGILNGKGGGLFAPNDNITVAEVIKIAACAHANLTGATIADGGENWYDKYVDYAKTSGIIENGVDFNYTDPATRAEIAYLFAHADVDKQFINPDVPLTDIPDVDESTPYYNEILSMYRLGAAVGSDEMLTFHPYDNVKRSEAAAMVVRIMNPEYRVGLAKG